MGEWDTSSDTEHSWEDAAEGWRVAALAFFIESTPGIATFPEYLQALTQAFHAEVFDATGERIPPELKFVGHIGGQVHLPAGPVKGSAVEPMRAFLRDAASAWRDPHGVPRRPPLVGELLREIETCTRLFFGENPWLGIEGGQSLHLSFEKAPPGRPVDRSTRWDDEPSEEAQAVILGHSQPRGYLEQHPQFHTSVARYLPDHREHADLDVRELCTLATTAANKEVRRLATEALPTAILCCQEEDVPRAEDIGLLGRAIAAAELPARARIASELVGMLSVNAFDLEAWRGVLTQLATDGEPLVRARFARTCRQNGDAVLPSEDPIDDRLRSDGHPMVVAAWSEDPLTLRTLAWHPDWAVRSFVAGCGDSEALDSLVEQGPALRGLIAVADALSSETALTLATDEVVEVRRSLACRHSWRWLDAVLDILVADPDRTVRIGLAQNSRVPVPVLERLATDQEAGFHAQSTLAKLRGLPAPSLRAWLLEKSRRT